MDVLQHGQAVTLFTKRSCIGKRRPTWALMRVPTERVALDVILSRAPRDCSGWMVEVYDADGRHVASMNFYEVLGNHRPGRR
ncbi:hypothetical protein FV232_16280 [Methylobacterium sp. WL30]|nr:hypothetical protein FV225_05810 [Methylobacterium sp. WL93]TXN49663.1 hypothetical protein FV227_15540 [Methylobacterium sp. WL119]TXN66156.1 hypothetical protein FV232_16280 [Methylobacterium sp. WL30]